MSIKEQIDKKKMIQSLLLDFLDNESNVEENCENFFNIIRDQKIKEDQHDMKSVLQMIIKIGNEHQRIYNFFSKIERILSYFKADIKNYFTNSEVFDLFESNKRLLLFLFQEKMIIVDEYVVFRITTLGNYYNKYCEYFSPEIKKFLTDDFIKKYKNKNQILNDNDFINEIKKEVPAEFYDKRNEGENDDYLCYLIRTNQVTKFGIEFSRRNLSGESLVKETIYETNPSLMTVKLPQLIEYAAFFGSIEIVKYLKLNWQAKLKPTLWNYAVHGRNAELIKYLEDNQVPPPCYNYNTVLKESIKCHHNDVSNYIINYLIEEKKDQQKNIENNLSDILHEYGINYCNYFFFPEEMKSQNLFYKLFGPDYYKIIKLCLEEGNFNINGKDIKKTIY